MRVAIVHDWLTGMRGGEKVLSLLCGLIPQADLLTLIHTPGVCDDSIERMRIRTSFLDDLPAVQRYYRYLLPIMPLAIEQMKADQYDLIVSCSHCVAKGIIRRPDAAHICYCFTPMRYVWSQEGAYQNGTGFSGLGLRIAGKYLRAWDRRSAQHVDRFLANSRNVAQRIRSSYARESEVVYSPVDTGFFHPSDQQQEDYYLMVTALSPYKRVDQAIGAFGRLARELRIIGTGPLLEDYRRSAPPNVEVMGWQSDEVVRQHYRRARAVILPGEEDFGLVPLEAMACGTPAIAYGAGGALETVLDVEQAKTRAPTGVLYSPQTTDALVSAVERFERLEHKFDRRRLCQWAQRFSPEEFTEKFTRSVQGLLREKSLGDLWSNDTTN